MTSALKDSPEIYSELWRTQKKGTNAVREIRKQLNSSDTLRVAAYIRLSPTGDEREEGSLVSHPQRIKDFVELKNRQTGSPWGEIADYYIDKDLSGKNLDRPSFIRLCKDIEAGLIDAVIVTELSRLSRRVKDFCHIWDFLKEHNVKFLSLKENFDTSTPMGELMLIQAISFAQFERETIVDRIKKGSRARAERGLANGNVPLGLSLIPGKTNHREINEDEKPYVQMIFRKMLELKKMANVLNYLNDNGYRTKEFYTKSGEKKGGKFWTVSSLHTLLTNRAYISQREFNKKNRTLDQSNLKEEDRYFFTDAQWPAIIEDKDFFDVQRLLENNKKKARKYVYTYKLSGLVRCTQCGEKLFGKSGTGKSSKYFYYGHNRKRKSSGDNHLKRCHIENIPAPQLEEIVLERLKHLANDKEIVTRLVKESHSDESKKYKHLKSLIASKENERRKIVTRVDNLIDAISECSEKSTRSVFQTKIAESEKKKVALENEISELRSELKNYDKKMIDPKAALDLLVKFRDNLDSQPPAIQAQILEDIVKEIKVYEDKIVLELYGSGTLNFEHKKTRTEGGSLLDGCSFRIQFGGGGVILVEQSLTVCKSIKTSYLAPRVNILKIQELSSHGMSRNAIARKLGLARGTVSKALQADKA